VHSMSKTRIPKYQVNTKMMSFQRHTVQESSLSLVLLLRYAYQTVQYSYVDPAILLPNPM
jgi:hypothetical protein